MADKMRRKSEVIAKTIPQGAPSGWKLIAGIAVLLTVSTIAVYWQVGGNDFVNYDDNVYVTNNRQVKMGLSWETVRWAFTSYDASNWHPLTWLSHMLDIQLFGMKAGGPHLVNVGFHIFNTLLLFWLLRYATRRLWPSALVAGLFALHPLHVESVAWVSERKDVLSTFFWLWTMLAYVYYTKRPMTLRYVAIVLLFAMGLLTKPMLVTLPLALVLIDYWPLERFEIRRQKGKISLVGTSPLRLLAEKMPLLMMAGGSAVVTVMAQRTAMPAWELMDIPIRVTNAVVSYWRYIWEMLWPADLAAFYPHSHKPLYAAAIVVLAFLVVATVSAIYVGKKRKYIVMGWLWYLMTLVPVVGFIQVGDQSHADRYTYVPLIGLFVVIAWTVAEVVERYRSLLKPVAAAAILIISVLGVLSWRQVGFWKDDVSLFRRATEVTQGNYVMLSNLGVTYSNMGELDRAEDAFRRSLQIRPNEGRTLNGLGSVMLKRQQYQQALDCFTRAVVLQPELKEVQLQTARTLMTMQRFADAEPYCRQAIKLDPYLADAHAQLGCILSETGRLEEAKAECVKAMKLDPKLALAHFNMAGVYVKQENFERAAEEYRKAIAINGDFSTWNNLGNSLLRLGKFQEAEKSYLESIKLSPDRSDAYYNMAISLEQQGRRAEAIDAIRKALALSPENKDIRRYMDLLTSKPSQGTSP
jgi:tetratricopeptide (TPR) repeat protein